MDRESDRQRKILEKALRQLIDSKQIPAGFWDAVAFRSRFSELPESEGGVLGMKAALEAAFVFYGPHVQLPQSLGADASAPQSERMLISAVEDLPTTSVQAFEHLLRKTGIEWADTTAVRNLMQRALAAYVIRRDWGIGL